MIEIQEPTDYTIRTERVTPNGLKIREELLHQGLGFEKMFQCFDYRGYTPKEIHEKFKKDPIVLQETESYKEYTLITYQDTQKFSMNRMIVHTTKILQKTSAFSILLILSGQGSLSYDDLILDLTPGTQIFLPHCVQEVRVTTTPEAHLEIIQCFPPI